MVRPCVASGFAELAAAVLHQCIRPLIGAFAPGHHGYQRTCVLISRQASIGPLGLLESELTQEVRSFVVIWLRRLGVYPVVDPANPPWRSAKMFQLFLKARANNYFKARSAGRDTETDHARATSIFRSIEDALEGQKLSKLA